MKIEPRKQIEIALLSGIVAKSALGLQGLEYDDLLRLSFAGLIEDIKKLEQAIPKNRKKGGIKGGMS